MLGAFGSVAGAAALRKKGSLKERRGPEAFERGSLFPTLLPQGMAMLYVGKVADTTGRRGALLLGLAWFVAGTLGSIGSPTPDWRCVMAWGQSAAIACDAIARDVLDDPEERVQVLTVISAFRLVGLALAPTVGALVRDAYGWRALFAALAAVGVLLAILTALLIPETLHEGQQSSPRVVAAAGTRQKSEPEEEEDDDAAPVAVPDDQGPPPGSFRAVLERLRTDGGRDVACAKAGLIALTFGDATTRCSAATLRRGGDTVVAAGVFAYGCFASRGCPPMARLQTSLYMRLMAVGSCVALLSTLAFSGDSFAMLNVVFGVAHAFGYAASMTLFTQPFPGNLAAKAAAVLLIARTFVATGLSDVHAYVAAAYGPAASAVFIALVSLLSQLAWLVLLSSDRRQRLTSSSSDNSSSV